MKRLLGIFFSAALTLAGSFPALADSFPSKSIRIIVPFTPGGSNDVLGRILATKLPDLLGVPVIVENKPGAAGNIGSDYVAKAQPDGYTLLVATNTSLEANPSLYKTMPFNPTTDLTPVAMLGSVPVVLAVSTSSSRLRNVHTIGGLVDAAKKSPGQISYASSGVGVINHLAAEMFASMTKTKLLHVPYKGTAPGVVDLLAGRVDMSFVPANSIVPHLQGDQIVALGVTSKKPSPLLPNIPAIASLGYPDFEGLAYAVLMAPAKTDPAVVDKLHAAVDKVLGDAGVKATLAVQLIETDPMPLVELRQLIQKDTLTWRKVVQEANIQAD